MNYEAQFLIKPMLKKKILKKRHKKPYESTNQTCN